MDPNSIINIQFTITREDQRLFYVTLATDDGQQILIQAHKMVLYTGSHVFRDVKSQSNHCNHANNVHFIEGNYCG